MKVAIYLLLYLRLLILSDAIKLVNRCLHNIFNNFTFSFISKILDIYYIRMD